MSDAIEMKKIVARRLSHHIERSALYGTEPPTRELFESKLMSSYVAGLKCCYCMRQMKLKSKPPFMEVPSFDHKIPLSNNGKNTDENIVICCCRCNVVKGTLRADFYVRMLELLSADRNARENILNGLFWGRRQEKIEQLKLEKLARGIIGIDLCVTCGMATDMKCRCGVPYCEDCAELGLCAKCGEAINLR